MSSIEIADAANVRRRVDTFTRQESSDTVFTQAMALVDPDTGNPLRPGTDGSVPVSAAALPLPAGAAEQATLAALLTAAQALQAIATALNGKTVAVNTGSIAGNVAVSNYPATQAVSGTFWQALQPVSVGALPALAAGSAVVGSIANTAFAISGALPAGSNALGSVAVSNFPSAWAVTGDFWPTTQAVSLAALPALAAGAAVIGAISNTAFNINGSLPAGSNALGSVAVSNFPASQLVTGSFWQATQPVSLAALPALAAGAAVIGAISNTAFGIAGALPAGSNALGSVAVSNFPASQTVNGTFWQATQPVSVSALPLPSGAASETGNLASILARTPALGAAASASSAPVVIATDQAAVPTRTADTTATGNVTTQNLVPAGVATASSAVEVALNGNALVAVQVTGTYTGALSAQGTIDGSTWVTLGGVPLQNLNSGAQAATIASATPGLYAFDAAGLNRVRITALAAVTGTATVSLRATTGVGLVALDAALPAGANTIGAVNIAASQTLGTVTTVGTVNSQTPVTPTTAFTNSAASTNATSTKASAGTVWSLVASNTNAAPRYLKLYNKASAPTVGTDVPALVLAIPASGVPLHLHGGSNGLRFATGIAWAVTVGAADTDTAAVAASEIKLALSFT